MNVVGVLDSWATKQPASTAIITSRGPRDKEITFAELREYASRLAGALRRRGVRPGDRVAVLVGLSIEFYVALIGVLWVGAIPVIVDPAMGVTNARRCFRKAELRAIVGSRKLQLLTRLVPELRRIPAVYVGTRGSATEPEDCADESPALLTYTSGSTGNPTPVVRSHALLIAQNAALQEVLHHHPGDRWLATLPIFVLAHLAEGATAVIADADLRMPGSIDGGRLAKQITRCGADAVVASPALLARLAAVSGWTGTFRSVFTGGAPVYPETIEQLRHLSASKEIVVVYGSTEAEPIAHHLYPPGYSYEESMRGGGLLVGPECSAVSVRVIRDLSGTPIPALDSEQFDRLRVRAGEPGEVVVTGDHVVKGYPGGEGDREAKIRVEQRGDPTVWHRTGDAARMDEHGQLWLLGRCTGRVKLDDSSYLYPFQAEIPSSHELGVPCAILQTDVGPVLAVSKGGGARESVSGEWVDRLLDSGVRLVEVQQIPLDKRHNAKVDYNALRILVEKEIGQ